MQHLFPHRVEANIHMHENKENYKNWLQLSDGNGADKDFGINDARFKTHTTSPLVWTNEARYIGGHDDTLAYIKTKMASWSQPEPKENIIEDSPAIVTDDMDVEYDYDLIVIGGGSGGLAASKEASKLGAKVAVLDYVKPSPQGTSWGLGGTCVNVGCIPKKLMHQSSLIGKLMHDDAIAFGWKSTSADSPTSLNVMHDWKSTTQSVQNYIHSLNFKYRVDLRDKKVKYENMLARFVDPHTIECSNPKKKKGSKKLTAKKFIIAVGGRPKPLSCDGGELAISSDDIFQLENSPGKTLVIGASYVALECAGFLRGMDFPVKILVRSILLRGFDQQIATMIGNYMEQEENIAFEYNCTPKSLEKRSDGKILVTWTNHVTGENFDDVFDTVLNATGRDADLNLLNLESVGVEVSKKNRKILANNEQTNVQHIYAIGDVLDGKPELTPVAIQAGRMLARRIYGNSTAFMNYEKICTAVFTPIEYGCCGLSEEDAKAKYDDDVEVYHQKFVPLEWSLSTTRKMNEGYVKLICNLADSQRIVGFHYLGPNAGEVTQAIGIAMNMNATFGDFANTVGIHPTTAEIFTTLEITKRSGADESAGGC